MKWLLWIFCLFLTVGLVGLFYQLYQMNAPTDVAYISQATPSALIEYQTPNLQSSALAEGEYKKSVVNQCLFYRERKPPVASPSPTPVVDTPITGGSPTPVVTPIPQSAPLFDVKYVTHFVNWEQPVVYLDQFNPQTGLSTFIVLKKDETFRNWNVHSITARRVVLKGSINNVELYQIYGPDLAPGGQQISKEAYAKMVEESMPSEGLPKITSGGAPTPYAPPPQPQQPQQTPAPPIVQTPAPKAKTTPPAPTPPRNPFEGRSGRGWNRDPNAPPRERRFFRDRDPNAPPREQRPSGESDPNATPRSGEGDSDASSREQGWRINR